MPKPWRAAARAKASSEISPRRLVVCSRSKGVWGLGRAWAGRWLRLGDGPLRLRMNLGVGSREMSPERQKALALGARANFYSLQLG
jgi:hypothetical protein